MDNDLDDLDLPYCDVLLSGLSVSPGSLVPQFEPYRTDYSASVGLSPVSVTLIPTNDHNATFLFLDENGVEIADADATLEGFQVEFGAGIPAIKIKVVSQDSQATYTYIVTDLGNRYDANDDRVIQRDEVISAIKDYFNDVITREETIEIIKLYFSTGKYLSTAQPDGAKHVQSQVDHRLTAQVCMSECFGWPGSAHRIPGDL